MPAAPPPADEAERLKALQGYHVLDTPRDETFDALTRLAARVCGTSIAAVALVDRARQWFLSSVGLEPVRETPRDVAFCAHTILQDALLEVPDATLDPRFADNPLVMGPPHIRRYAGVPLVDVAGHHLGSLCVIDAMPGTLDDQQRQSLLELARLAMAMLEGRRRDHLEHLRRRDLESELAQAAEMVNRLVHVDDNARPRVRHAIVPASRFSGDIVGAVCGGDGTLYLIHADVMGHGLSSALLIIPLLDTFHAMAVRGHAVGDIAQEINGLVRRHMPSGFFVALVCVAIAPDGGPITVWNGGSPAGVWLSADGGRSHAFRSRHLALGILRPEEFDAACEVFEPGARGQVCLFSDGVTDLEDPRGEAFGRERLDAVLLGHPPGDRFDALQAALTAFAAGAAPHDDISVLIADC